MSVAGLAAEQRLLQRKLSPSVAKAKHVQTWKQSSIATNLS